MTPRELRDYWIITPDDAFPRRRDNRATWPMLVLALARSREQVAAALADVLDRANAKEKP